LEEGEKALDFTQCECGGKLKYSPDFKEKRRVERAKENGGVSLDLDNKRTIDNKLFLDPRLTRLIIGMLIVLIPSFLYPDSIYLLTVAFLLSGLVSSLFIKGDDLTGLLNGTRVGIYSLVVYLIVAYTLSIFQITNLLGNLLYILVFAVLLLTFTSLGGLIGITTRRMIDKPKIKEEQIISEEVIKVQDPAVTQYHDEMVNIGYKKVKAINDAENIFKALLAGKITEFEALESLREDQEIIDQVCIELKQITPPDKYCNYHELKVSATEDITKTFHIIDGLVLTDTDKIQKTDSLVDQSTLKINQAINEIHRNMQNEDFYE
jgi:hypothetical protein